jgi:hypothetical protein
MANRPDPNQSRVDVGLEGDTIFPRHVYDPVVENNYWTENWSARPYTSADLGYSYYEPAYRLGWESRMRYRGHRWEDVEGNIMREWESARSDDRDGAWEDVKHAVKDAWDRLTK